MAGQREEVIRQEQTGSLFLAGKWRGKMARGLVRLSDFSAFPPISDSELLLLRTY